MPLENLLSGDRRQNIHLWTVVRVLQHTTPMTETPKKSQNQLNLSSDDSLSACSFEEEGLGDKDTDAT